MFSVTTNRVPLFVTPLPCAETQHWLLLRVFDPVGIVLAA